MCPLYTFFVPSLLPSTHLCTICTHPPTHPARPHAHTPSHPASKQAAHPATHLCAGQCVRVLLVHMEAPVGQRACEVEQRSIWHDAGVSRGQVPFHTISVLHLDTAAIEGWVNGCEGAQQSVTVLPCNTARQHQLCLNPQRYCLMGCTCTITQAVISQSYRM
jgi:hypothetical protein